MNTADVTNKMDCIFYFIVKHESKARRLKEEAERKIGKKFASVIGAQNYATLSSPYLRSTLFLKKHFEEMSLKGMSLKKILIVFIDEEKDDVSLLSALERDLFVEKILASTVDDDTVKLIEDVIRKTEDKVEIEEI